MTQANESPENQPIDADSLELKLPDESGAWKDIGLWAGVLALLTLIAYWPATTGSFIWRDSGIAENKTLLGPSGISHIWLDRWQNPDQFKNSIYQPIAGSAYWLEYRAGGHDSQGLPAPTTYHIASLIFHVWAAILLWLVLRELLMPGAWLIAAIFALHPLQTEGVSWISQQFVVLSGLFFFGSIYLYLMFMQSIDADIADRAAGGVGIDPVQTWGFYAGSAACGLLAMLSNPSTVVLPVIVLLLLWWRDRMKSRDILLQLPLLIIGAVLWFKNVDLNDDKVSLFLRAEAIGQAMGFSLFKLFLPFGQSIIYFNNPSFVGLILFSVAIFSLVALFAFHRGLFVALVSFLLFISFSVNWFDPTRISWLTDSTAYLAIVPLIIVVISLIRRLKLPGPHPQSVVTAATVLLLVLGSLAWVRTHAFDNSVALWRDTLRKDPSSTFAEASLAEQLRFQAIDDTAQGNTDAVKPALEEAISHAQAVVPRDPSNSAAQRTWADALVAEGENAAAMPHFEIATKLDPTNVDLRTEYAATLIKLGRFQQAIPQLNEALHWDMDSSATHRLLGEAYQGVGNIDRAIKEQQLALELDPHDFAAWEKLAQLQVKTGKLEDAIASYAKILGDTAQQNRPELWVALAKIKDQQGVYMPAVQYYQAAVKVAPDDADIAKLLKDEQEKLNKAAATRPAATQVFK